MSWILVFMASFFSLPAMAEGTSIRGGGDEVALEFADSLRAAVVEVRERFPSWANEIDLATLNTAPDRATIFVTNAALMVPAGEGEQESVAVNDPAINTIWINRPRWQAITNDRIRRAIALHEFLSLQRVEGTGRYPYSAQLLVGGEASIVSGQEEPSPANWNRLRLRCYTRGKFLQADGTMLDAYGNTVSVQSSWRVAGRVYDLRYALLSFNHGDEGAPKFEVPSFEQSYRAPEWNSPQGTLYQWRRRSIAAPAGADTTPKFEEALPEALLFEEKLGENRTRTWSWEGGRKRKALWQSFTRRRDDGTREVTSDWLHFPSSGSSEKEEKRVCAEELTEGEWLSEAARTEIGAWIDSLTELSARANIAADEFATCNPANCAELEKRAEEALGAFEAAWDGLYREMKAKLEAPRA